MRTTAARVMGVAALGYGVAVAWRPRLLARPCGLPEQGSSALLIRALGVRDAVIGAAMATLPAGSPQRTAVLCRVAVDTGDALLFGTFLAHRTERAKAAAAALTWAALCGWTLTGCGYPAAPLVRDAANVAVRAAQSATTRTCEACRTAQVLRVRSDKRACCRGPRSPRRSRRSAVSPRGGP
ncbi:hypothetical protein [Streptomyces sp. E-08]|uniref:hypothetical protein n=1 Tax=Streptomyces sp. E-08 TaxID=3404047 RepID=UPI003CF24B93